MARVSALTLALCSMLLWAPAVAFEDFDMELDLPWMAKPAPAAVTTTDDEPVPVVKPVDPRAPFPKLPPVNAMLNGSDHTVSSIVTEVSRIQARVHNLEQNDQRKLAHKKAEFESELKAQEQATRMVIKENVQIAARIAVLKKGNDGLRKTAKGLKEENKQMRAELRSAGSKLAAAGEFVKTSLVSTDDKNAPELFVLSGKKTTTTTTTTTDDSAITDGANDDSHGDADDDVKDQDDHDDGELSKDTTHKAALKAQPKPQRGLFGRIVKAVAKKKDDKDDDDKDDDKDDDDDDKDDKDDKDDGKAESFLALRMRTRRVHAERSEESTDSEAEAGSEMESEAEEGTQSEEEQLPWQHPQPKKQDASLPPVDGQSRALLQSVNQELQNLALEDHEGLERETAIFHAKSAQEEKAHQAAILQQQQLNKTETSLLNLQSRLKIAVSHLQETKSHLDQRLRGLGQYLQHLAHLLLAPAKEAGTLVDQMSEDVAIPPPVNSTQPQPRGLVMLQMGRKMK